METKIDWSKYKNLIAGRERFGDPEVRFWMAVKSSRHGCWEWTNFNNTRGYGMLFYQGSSQLAHRVSWQIHNGPIPAGLFVCHQCDNPKCVRPSHLFLGTALDNARDRDRKGRAGKLPSRKGCKGLAGESHPMAVLSESDVLLIRRRLEEGESSVAIGKEYGVDTSTISAIRRRRIWRHI